MTPRLQRRQASTGFYRRLQATGLPPEASSGVSRRFQGGVYRRLQAACVYRRLQASSVYRCLQASTGVYRRLTGVSRRLQASYRRLQASTGVYRQ